MKLPSSNLRPAALSLLLAATTFHAWAQPSAPAAPPPLKPETAPADVKPDAAPAAPVDPAKRWEKDIADFEKQDAATPPPKKGVVFIGSSTLKIWGPKLLTDFAEIPAINRGFGGSQMADAVRYADRIVIPYDPRVVVVYAGGNDLNAKRTPDQLMESHTEFEAKIHQALPDAIVVYVSLNPTIKRLADEPKVQEVNKRLAEFAASKPKTVFIDSYSKMIGADGKPQEKFLRADKLHPSPEGYANFLEAIKPGIVAAYVKAGGTPSQSVAK